MQDEAQMAEALASGKPIILWGSPFLNLAFANLDTAIARKYDMSFESGYDGLGACVCMFGDRASIEPVSDGTYWCSQNRSHPSTMKGDVAPPTRMTHDYGASAANFQEAVTLLAKHEAEGTLLPFCVSPLRVDTQKIIKSVRRKARMTQPGMVARTL